MVVLAKDKVSELCECHFCRSVIVTVFLHFVFFFSPWCMRRDTSITSTSQTSRFAPNQWLIDWLSSRHGHTSVALTVTKRKQEYKLGLTVCLRGQGNTSLTIMTQIHLWLLKTLFPLLPPCPSRPSADCMSMNNSPRCSWTLFTHVAGFFLEDILTIGRRLRRRPVSDFALHWLHM